MLVGVGCYDRLKRLQQHLDDLLFRIDPANRDLGGGGGGVPAAITHKKRKAMRHAADALRKRIRDLVDDMHTTLSTWLCDNYDLIVYTPISAQQLVRRGANGKRKLSRSTARGLLTVGFARFRERLQHQAQLSGRQFKVANEAYTTQGCPCCGHLNKQIKAKKLYICPQSTCQFVCDRDCVGATNIWLRLVTESGIDINSAEGSASFCRRELGASPVLDAFPNKRAGNGDASPGSGN